jgi:hypothetical protein
VSSEQDKLNELFSEALTCASPEERRRFLDTACGADRELRGQVDSLLLAHSEAGDFLKQTVVPRESPAIGEGPGSVIGRYRLLQVIGEGGFGVVFMAEQQEPVRRMVALKILKPGMDTREVIARFEAERQALALMDHPNIARALDGGVASSGRPYFVMDLVKGVPITQFCDKHNFSIEQRLQLFLKACGGVQNAHQKGVIHRDLKPSNILVTLHDGEPVPKVIDFGVAKAIGQKLTERTLFTRFEQLIGTPAYMSPEQAEWSGLDVDTRTDIYALGVLLYELLTGTTPFEKETLAQAALDEVRRVIRETEPPAPSTRLLALGKQADEIARQRQIEPVMLFRQIRGELDWIVLKSLEKDRNRRYETVNALGRDLERHLNGEPVLAFPPSAAYRAQKFIRKHRFGVAAVGGIAAALGIGLVLALAGFAQARQASRQAREKARIAGAVNDFLVKDLLSATTGNDAALDGTVNDLLLRAAETITHHDWYDVAGPRSEPELRQVVAELRRQLGPEHPAVLKYLIQSVMANGCAADWDRCVALCREITSTRTARHYVMRGPLCSTTRREDGCFPRFCRSHAGRVSCDHKCRLGAGSRRDLLPDARCRFGHAGGV